MDQHVEGGKNFLDGVLRGRGVLVAAQVDHHPGDVAQERDGDLGVDETQQRLNNSKGNDVISQGRAVTNDVACKMKRM